jgi:putative Holliday junction resolvase
MKRVMGLDYGSKTVGVAVNDLLGLTAQAVETIQRSDENNLKGTISRLGELIESYEVETIVLGLPVNMNTTSGERVAKTEKFKRRLEREFGLEVVFEDERLTTAGAMRFMEDTAMSGKKKKQVVDKMAAAIILQSYMDRQQ